LRHKLYTPQRLGDFYNVMAYHQNRCQPLPTSANQCRHALQWRCIRALLLQPCCPMFAGRRGVRAWLPGRRGVRRCGGAKSVALQLASERLSICTSACFCEAVRPATSDWRSSSAGSSAALGAADCAVGIDGTFRSSAARGRSFSSV